MTTNSPHEPELGAAVYGEIFASSAVGVAVWRDDGRIEQANQALAELVGATHSDELIGIALSSCFSEMYQPRMVDSLNRAVRAQSSSVVEAEVPHGGDNRLLLVTNIGAASLRGGISLVIDLTASLTALALASSPADSGSAASRLNAALAHEINNPLAYAMGNLSFAIESLHGVGDRYPELATVVLALRDALEGAERVRRTVRELRLSSRRASAAASPLHETDARALDEPETPRAADAPSGTVAVGSARASSDAPPPGALRRGRVLVVDHEPRIGSAIARVLSPLHEVAAVSTAREALIRLEAGEHFDVILCDVMMPDASGGDLYQTLAAGQPALAWRVVFMTGGPFSARGASFLEGVPNTRLEKPFSPEALRLVIQRVLSGVG